MRALFLHIGIHKTATTAVQKTFSRSRALLKENGILYPDYNAINRPVHYCHHDIARSIGGDNGPLNNTELRRFFRSLGAETHGDTTCLLSSEIFYRLHVSNPTPDDCFIKKVHEFCKYSELQPIPVITLREQASFADSLYREHVKQTRFSSDFPIFFRKFQPWFDFKTHLETWASVFGNIKVLAYEELDRSNIAEDFCRKAINKTPGLPQAPLTNPSLSYDWVLVKKVLNNTALSPEQLKSCPRILDKLQARLGPSGFKNNPKAHFISQQNATEMFQRYEAGNAYIATKFMGLPHSPFRALKVNTPSRKTANLGFLQAALNEVLKTVA